MRAVVLFVLLGLAGLAAAEMQIVGDKIATSAIHYNTVEKTVRADSFATLNALAKLLKGNPKLAVVEIAVHTHPAKDATSAVERSQAYADAVRAYLVKQGVADGRLRAKGYGGSQPLDKQDTPEAFRNNTRTEFVIVERR